MKFKEKIETVATSDLYDDLFNGGYIKPENMLWPKDAEKVNQAISLIDEFITEAEENGAIELL